MKCFERDPSAQAWRNTNPQLLIQEIQAEAWNQIDWTTYSFANRRFYDKIHERRLSDEDIIKKMILFYQRLSKRTGQTIHPHLFISWWDKSLHFHAIECSSGLTRKARAQAFRQTFKRLHRLPKDLYNSMIDSKRWDPQKGAVFYASGGHNEIFTKPFGPKRKEPIQALDISKKDSAPSDSDPYTVELLAALNS